MQYLFIFYLFSIAWMNKAQTIPWKSYIVANLRNIWKTWKNN